MAMTESTKAIAVVERVMAEGLIKKYAIGGALGALFYLEPTQTEDIDIFIHVDPLPGSSLISVGPLFERLRELGYTEWRNENIVVEEWPIQFLPVTKSLEVQALEKAIRFPAPDFQPYVFSPEYLMAICLNLFRPKDKVRLEQFHRQHAFDPEKLKPILSEHGLTGKWQKLLELFEAGPSMLS